MKLKSIYSSPRGVVINRFSGLNRRIRASGGEFFDMENLSAREYPCVCTLKMSKDMGYDLPEGLEAVKMIIPKRLDRAITGFSGVVWNSKEERYEIYVNGVSKRNDIKYFSDAVDYNGAIIVMPELKGYSYAMKSKNSWDGKIEPAFYSEYMWFNYETNQDYIYIDCPRGYTNKEKIESLFSAGDSVILSGLTGDAEVNNTIFPESSLDFSNTKSPASISINGIDYNGTNTSGFVKLAVSLKNSKGETCAGWAKNITKDNKLMGTITKLMPYSTYGCVAHNRLWLCSYSGEEILASAAGSPFDFYSLSGISSDSWIAATGTPGKFTGVAAWQNREVVFKSDIIHIVYGSLPSSFGIEKSYAAGCIDRNSIAEVGGCLMWLYYDGFYIYSGSRPKRISDKLNTKYKSCKAFSDGRKYYARCVKEDGTGEFLIYDSELGLWSKISDIDVVSGDYYGGKVYVCDKTKMYCLGEGEYGDFYAETPELTFETFMDKSVIYATVRCIIKGGFLNVYTSVNNGEWVPHKGIDKTGKHRLPVRHSPGDILRLRLEGSGNVCITEIEFEVVTK